MENGSGFLIVILIAMGIYCGNLKSDIKELQANYDDCQYQVKEYSTKLEDIQNMASSRDYNYSELLDDIESEADY